MHHILSKEEYSTLKFALKYGVATRTNESNILAYAEDIWEQIDKSNICCYEFYSKSKMKKSLRGLEFNMIIFENNRIFKDSRKTKIMQQLCQNVAILRRDEGNGVDLLDSQDYVNSVE